MGRPIVLFSEGRLSKEDIEEREKYLSEKFGRKVIILDASYNREILEL